MLFEQPLQLVNVLEWKIIIAAVSDAELIIN